MTDEEYIREAIAAAKEAEIDGGLPIGAVLVKDGEIIARAKSLPWSERDVTNHTEIDCIRMAATNHGLKDLSGCTLYGTIEPCSMCLGACYWARIDHVVFGAYAKDITGNEYEYRDYSAKEYAARANHSMTITGGIMRDDCKLLLKDYKDWQKQL